RRDKRALPHPGLGFACRLLIRFVILRSADQRQRPAVRHHPFLDVLAIGLAARHDAAAAVDRTTRLADPVLAAELLGKFITRRGAAGPALALGVEAKLI